MSRRIENEPKPPSKIKQLLIGSLAVIGGLALWNHLSPGAAARGLSNLRFGPRAWRERARLHNSPQALKAYQEKKSEAQRLGLRSQVGHKMGMDSATEQKRKAAEQGGNLNTLGGS